MCVQVFKRLCFCVLLAGELTTEATELPIIGKPAAQKQTADAFQRLTGQAPRGWTEANRGRTASALLLAANESTAWLQKSDLKVVAIPLNLLGTEDKHYIREALLHSTLLSKRTPPTEALKPVGNASNVKRLDKNIVENDLSPLKLVDLSPSRAVLRQEVVPWNMIYVSICATFSIVMLLAT